MSSWDSYPSDYRLKEVQAAVQAVRGGECVSFLGLSGSGKSNLLGYLAHRWGKAGDWPRLVLVDCNRLADASPASFYRLIRTALGDISAATDELIALEARLGHLLAEASSLGLLLDPLMH